MSDAALVLEHDQDAPAGLLDAWARERGVALEVVPAGAPIPDPAARPFLVSLGAEASAYDDAVPWLAAERAALDRAIACDVPILGICFGGQHLARALGGTVAPADRAEVGWLDVETLAPDVVPPGPWLQWHRDRFTVPPGAELLARSPVCPQAFRLGPHLGVQFHPEVTPAIALDWGESYPASVAEGGTTLAAVRRGGEAHAVDAAVRARRLFDAFLASARSGPRMSPEALG
ncbi:MAG TPA: type 1 glutamine amidotransferase [Baekduia sp.]